VLEIGAQRGELALQLGGCFVGDRRHPQHLLGLGGEGQAGKGGEGGNGGKAGTGAQQRTP